MLSLISFEHVVESLSRVWLCAPPWTAAPQASLSITISWSLPKFMPIESAMPSYNLILCRPLLLLPSIFPSIRVIFSSELAIHIRWPKYGAWALASVLLVNIQGWFLTGVVWSPCCPRTLKNLFQHHSSKPSIFQHSAFFMVQLSHLYMTTGKIIAMTIQTFVGEVLGAYITVT